MKNELNNISDEPKLPENSNFLKLIKDINDTKSIIININLPEALKLFNSFHEENKNLFEKIEENSKKMARKMKNFLLWIVISLNFFFVK